jgi:hypothetical protein
MALTVNHPTLKEVSVHCHSASIGGTPAAAYARAPFRGKIVKVGGVTGGAITTADCAVAVAINGTAVTGGAFTITLSGAAAGQLFSAVPTAAYLVNEDDVISFTPSGASGSAIPGTFFAVIQTA